MKHQSQELNRDYDQGCVCAPLDRERLRGTLDRQAAQVSIFDMLQQKSPTMFAARSVQVLPVHLKRMEEVVQAIETVVALPAFRQAVLADAPAVAKHAPGAAKGVFFGYDFHIDGDNLGLIEINTNAGGGLLNAALAAAHGRGPMGALEDDIVAMFLSEWQLAGCERPLRTIAIVDEDPVSQYFYAEFLMFQRLFQAHGIQAVIAAPDELHMRDGALMYRDIQIDMVYNRLCDFLLETPAATALRQAYLAHAAVLTPHPQAYALYADKRVLAWLCDPAWLSGIGVPQPLQRILRRHIPHTEMVGAANADRLWQSRKQLFFKPRCGFGSRGVFRGDKISRKGWSDVLASDYVAQAFFKPGESQVESSLKSETFKFDVRNYAYAGKVQQVAARLYQGLRTNFQVPGSGFSWICSGMEHKR